MKVEELEVSARVYNALKNASIDTVEDLCRLTGEQLMKLSNFGKKSLDELRRALAQHSLSLHTGSADPRLLVSSVKAGPRFNIGLSTVRGDRGSLAGYTLREIHRISEHLELVRSRVSGPVRGHLSSALGHLAILKQVHETVLAAGESENSSPEKQH